MIPRLKKQYRENIIPKLMESRGYKNPMQVPAVKKVVLNLCLSLNSR